MAENSYKEDISTYITDHKQLTTIYKKNGSFDKQRRLLLENFRKSETHSNLLLKLKLMIENKIKNDPTILMKNKGKMGALIQGEIINQHLNSSKDESNNKKPLNNNNFLSIVDKDIQEKIIDSPEFHEILKVELKDIKRKLLGITDEDYEQQLKIEEENKQKEIELAELRNKEKELSYKNNFKVKKLNPNHKITKTPKFNFNSNSHSNSTSQNFRENRNSKSSGSDSKSKDIPYLMY